LTICYVHVPSLEHEIKRKGLGWFEPMLPYRDFALIQSLHIRTWIPHSKVVRWSTQVVPF